MTTETMPIGVGTYSPTAVIVGGGVTVAESPAPVKTKGRQMTHARFVKLAASHPPPDSWYEENPTQPRKKR
jgi:hypothetical protein